MARPRSRRDKLLEVLEGFSTVGEGDLPRIQAALQPISDRYLRTLLRASGVALSPMVEGVRQDSFEELERTLRAVLGEYEKGDRARQTLCRRAVIEAKDHARLAAGKAADERKKVRKQEMVLWMLTWLENPPLFPEWVALRRKSLGASGLLDLNGDHLGGVAAE